MQQTAVKTGIITGIATVLYLFVFHLLDRALVLNPLVYWSTLLFAVAGMVVAVRNVRSENGNKISQREALKTAFLVFVLAQLLFWAFIFVLFNVIDPSLVDLQKAMIEKAGIKLENQDLRMTFGKIFFRYAYMLIPGFFLSYMVASFMKK